MATAWTRTSSDVYLRGLVPKHLNEIVVTLICPSTYYRSYRNGISVKTIVYDFILDASLSFTHIYIHTIQTAVTLINCVYMSRIASVKYSTIRSCYIAYLYRCRPVNSNGSLSTDFPNVIPPKVHGTM